MNVTTAEKTGANASVEALDHRDRLWTAAEQLRLAAVALNGMSRARLDAAPDLAGHIERLEHRSAELMRAAARLGEALSVSGPWGLDILFQPAEPIAPRAPAPAKAPSLPATVRRKHRPVLQKRVAPRARLAGDPMNESIELAPIELLAREVPIVEPRRGRRMSAPPIGGPSQPPRAQAWLPPPLEDSES
ncbi:MAG: hypothetical protein H6703_08550 [Myxococcales bacterium]|nr:hypothetical protein [Myxococcales bacterium]MCB9552429.1 hypothetical protein [Myxococcales bacterium]